MKKFKNVLIVSLLLLPVLLFGQNDAYGEGKLSPYTAYFISSMQDAEKDTTNFKSFGKRFRTIRDQHEKYISAFIELDSNNESTHRLLESYGVMINSVFTNTITGKIPVDKIETVALLDEVKHVEMGVPVRKKMDNARAATKVDDVLSSTGLSQPYKGKDVIVGIVDGGFEYGHINFYNTDATELRVKRVWDQDASGTSPEGYNYGTEYTTTSAMLNARYDIRQESHGTHVAGIAAGADRALDNKYYGVAPESDIVLVSYIEDSDNASILDGLTYIYNYADEVGKPCVANLSLGSHIGPHDGTSYFDSGCDELLGPGKLLVGAAGNEGADPLHVSKNFTPEDNTLKTFFNFFKSNDLYGEADIWGDTDKDYTVQIVVYNSSTGAETYTSSGFNANQTARQTITLSSATHGASGKVIINSKKDSKNSKGNVFVVTELISLKTSHHIGIRITATEGTVHAWADDYWSVFSDKNIEGWTDGDYNYSVGEIGGTGKRIISVGSYITKDYPSVGSLSSFSSIGPTTDGRMKPEITAPGSVITSSFSSYAVASDSYYRLSVVTRPIINGVQYYYGALEGTSMASPHVAGILATWLEAKNDLTPEEVKSILQSTAINDGYTGSILPDGNNTWGYGKINAWEGIKKCLSYTSVDKPNAPGKKLMVYKPLNENNVYISFPKEDKNVNVYIFDVNGRKIYENRYDVVNPTGLYSIDINNFEIGAYILRVSGAQQTYQGEKIIIK